MSFISSKAFSFCSSTVLTACAIGAISCAIAKAPAIALALSIGAAVFGIFLIISRIAARLEKKNNEVIMFTPHALISLGACACFVVGIPVTGLALLGVVSLLGITSMCGIGRLFGNNNIPDHKLYENLIEDK